jgi:DNA-binding transcriptional LysR family regulator
MAEQLGITGATLTHHMSALSSGAELLDRLGAGVSSAAAAGD